MKFNINNSQDKIDPMKRKVFLAISYTERRKVEQAITNFFTNRGFTVITGRKIRPGLNQCDELMRIIKDCDFGLVVYNELRHNISYEWGLLDALIGEKGHVFFFKDVNVHINLDYELSDKKGINFVAFYGEDDEKDIIKSFEENEGLIDMMEECIGRSISNDQNEVVTEAAEAILNVDLPLKPIINDKGEIISSHTINTRDLENLKDKLNKITNLTVEGLFYKSVTYFYMGELEQAETEIKKAINLNKGIAALHGNYGVILAKLGRNEEAKVELKTAVILDPADYHAHCNLGIILMRLKLFEDAKSSIENGISLDSENALGYALLGGVFLNLHEYNNAETALLKSIELDPNLEMSHSILGMLYALQGRANESKTELKKALILNPQDLDVSITLARIYIGLNEYLNAEKELKSVINIDPHNAQAHSAYGFLLSKIDGKEIEADEKFQTALSLDNDDIGIKADYGEYLIGEKRYGEAETLFNGIKESNPNNSLGYLNLAFLLDKKGHKDLAKKEYEIALDLDPDINNVITFGAFLIKWGFINDAKKVYLDGLKIDPDNPILLLSISELYIILSDFHKSYDFAEKGFKNSGNIKDKVINKFLMHISEILLEKTPDESSLINFFKENRGYEITFEFDTLSHHLKTSKYYDKIKKLIIELKRYSKNGLMSF